MSTPPTAYPFDPTGQATTNLITGERQILTPPNWGQFYFILPLATPFFANNKFQAVLQPSGKVLQEGVDFVYCYRFYDATYQSAAPVYGGLYFMDMTLSGVIELQYQTLGGDWTLNSAQIATVLANQLSNPIVTTWEEVVNVPYQFPPVAHQWDIIDMVGASDIVNVLNQMVTALQSTNNSALAAHLADFNNPHRVTAAQVGLGNVVNYGVALASDAQSGSSATLYMTPATTLVEINTFAVAPLNAHIANQGNPHNTTAAQVGLGNVNNFGWASTANAQAGTATNAYMNPALTAAAIASQALAPLNTHIGNLNNPHDVTATQVGLSNVPNYPVATLNQAQTGTDNASLMTPYLVSQLLGGSSSNGIAGQLEAHIDNFNNPHQVSATQVGLGNVQNYAMARDSDAVAGTSTSLYMSPETTLAAITNQLEPYAAHIADTTDNPHQVTADQVGLGNVPNFAMASLEDAEAGTATNEFMSPALTAAAVNTQVGTAFNAHVADLDNPHDVTAAQVGAYTTEQVDTQMAALSTTYLGITAQAADSVLLAGLTPDALVAEIEGAIPATTKLIYPADTNTAAYWLPLYWQQNYTPVPASPLAPIVAYVQGGEALGSEGSAPLYLVSIDPLFPSKAKVECLNGSSSAVSFGYTLNATGGLILYMVCPANRSQVSMLMLSDPFNNFVGISQGAGIGVTTVPVGLVALTQVITNPAESQHQAGAGELAIPSGFAQAHQVSAFANGQGSGVGFASLLQYVSVATTSDEITAAQAIQTPWISQWRNMGRIAAYGEVADMAVPLGGLWGWNNQAGQIEGPTTAKVANTTLLSTEAMPANAPYEIEVELSSADAGDESLGVCFGYVVADGKAFALHALRTPGGTMVDAVVNNTLPGANNADWGLFTVGLNLLQSDALVIASNSAALTFGDGTAGSVAGHVTSYVPNAVTAGSNGWASKGVVRIKVSYDGDGNFTLDTTDFNDTTGAYVSAAQLTFNLSSFVAPAGRFKGTELSVLFAGPYGGLKWGLAAYNQALANFDILACPDYYGRYVDYHALAQGDDASTLQFYTGNPSVGTDGWASYVLETYPVLLPGRLVYSDVNNTLWQVRRDGTLNALPIIAFTGSAGSSVLTA